MLKRVDYSIRKPLIEGTYFIETRTTSKLYPQEKKLAAKFNGTSFDINNQVVIY